MFFLEEFSPILLYFHEPLFPLLELLLFGVPMFFVHACSKQLQVLTVDTQIVLGNKDAVELPDTKGRGIWSLGNKMTVVQAPYISDVDIVERCSRIKAEFIKNMRKLYAPMIEVSTQNSAAPQGLSGFIMGTNEQPDDAQEAP